jgi:hypothetical protein
MKHPAPFYWKRLFWLGAGIVGMCASQVYYAMKGMV